MICRRILLALAILLGGAAPAAAATTACIPVGCVTAASTDAGRGDCGSSSPEFHASRTLLVDTVAGSVALSSTCAHRNHRGDHHGSAALVAGASAGPASAGIEWASETHRHRGTSESSCSTRIHLSTPPLAESRDPGCPAGGPPLLPALP